MGRVLDFAHCLDTRLHACLLAELWAAEVFMVLAAARCSARCCCCCCCSVLKIQWLQASFIGALFVLVTVPVTFYEVAMHLEYFSRPALQIHVIRILWMVPIYAIDAWIALRFEVTVRAVHGLMLPSAAPGCDTLPGGPARILCYLCWSYLETTR